MYTNSLAIKPALEQQSHFQYNLMDCSFKEEIQELAVYVLIALAMGDIRYQNNHLKL